MPHVRRVRVRHRGVCRLGSKLWASPLQILASLLGWVALAEGVLLIVAGRSFLRSVDVMFRNLRAIRIYMAVVLALGLVLVFPAFA